MPEQIASTGLTALETLNNTVLGAIIIVIIIGFVFWYKDQNRKEDNMIKRHIEKEKANELEKKEMRTEFARITKVNQDIFISQLNLKLKT